MLRIKANAIAKSFKLDVVDLKWYAAFHNESTILTFISWCTAMSLKHRTSHGKAL